MEKEWGTPRGEREKRTANNGGYERLRVGTVRWAMADALEHPPPGFEAFVTTHFKLKAAYVLDLVAGWLREAAEPDVAHGPATHLADLSSAARLLGRQLEDKLGVAGVWAALGIPRDEPPKPSPLAKAKKAVSSVKKKLSALKAMKAKPPSPDKGAAAVIPKGKVHSLVQFFHAKLAPSSKKASSAEEEWEPPFGGAEDTE